MNKDLTPKQSLIYKFIQKYLEESHMPPSLRDIGGHFDISVGTMQDQVEAIRRKGFLKKEETKARGLHIATSPLQVPILGRVHAGPLHAAIEDIEGYLPIGASLSPSQHFALRVKGDSMIGAGILEGDVVIVRHQEVAESGDIVVARIDEEATVKRFKQKGRHALLEAANPNYPPISGVPFVILGVVVEVRRHYWR